MRKYRIRWTDRIAKPIESKEEAIAIGKEMAEKAAKKLKLDFELRETQHHRDEALFSDMPRDGDK